MFSVDIYNNLEPLSIYLTKPSGNIICCLDKDINEEDAKITVGLNQQLELQFTATNDYTNENTSYDALQEGMYLFVEKIGLFKMKQPTIENDGIKETKSITAYSCDVELEDKNCTLSLNMGTSTSQEYLVTYDDNETESLVNPYTNIPYDWLVIYNTFPEQLSKMASKYSSGYYGSKNSSGEIVIRNTSLINELQEMFNLIPRLKSKITQTTDSNGITNSTLTEYVTFTYDSSGENVTTITLLSNFLSRINALITFYTKYRSQLSLLSVVLEATNGSWSIGDIYGVSEGDYSLANRKYQFESDETIYSFLTHTLAEASNCIVSFDILNRKVNMTPVDKIGNDTGIILSYENLVNMLNISCNDETLTTRLYVNGGNDLSIRQVNFGLDYIDDITYKLNAKDGNGKRIYVSDELATKYTQYIAYRESQRANYIQYSKDYRYYDEQISELQYRVPNDSLKTDWGTFSYAELEAALTTYKNLLAALVTLYKEDYGTAGVNADGSVNENYIKNTMYWYDYEAYKNTITEIECACHTYPYYSDQSKWTATDLAQYKEAIKAWETEWTLYGTIELQAKIDAYTADMKILAEQSVIPVSSGSDTIKKWSQLTSEEKESFGNLESNYFYDTYMSYYNNRQSAKNYLATLQSTIDSYERAKTTCQNNRLSIVKNVTLSNYFTEEECKQINLLYRDSSYSNENILTTSIDSSSESIDRMYELLEDSQEKLSSLCRPQLTFNVNCDNLLGLVEFKPFWSHFFPGNYILVQYKDDVYVKLRMIGFQFNPCLPSSKDFSITFSNYVRSKTMVSDLESLLGLSASSGTNGSSGSSSSSGGTYGESDDIDVTISNTMLAKLLNSEMFGTRVTNIILDTVDVNSITARYAKFEGLAKGTTLIDGKCITTGYIIDQTYNGTNGSINNSAGSVINLETGKFSFAGGKIKFDGTTLSVKGSITADSGYIGGEQGFTIASGKMYSNGHSAFNTAKEGVYIGTDYISLGNGGATYFKNDGTGKIGTWYINANSIYRSSSTWGIKNGMYFGTNGLSISDVFKVDSAGNTSITDKFSVTADGALTATSANITGNFVANKLTATSEGKIACWTINSTSIYYGNANWGNAGGMYFGTNGLSLSNKFTVTASGNVNIGNKLKFDGTNLTFSSDVTMSWGQITGTSEVATKTYASNAASQAVGSINYTQITKDYVVTPYLNATYLNTLNITAGSVKAENITGTTISGKTLSGGSISIGSNFYVNTSGTMTADGATVTGTIRARTMVALKAYYICDSDFGNNVRIISAPSDNTTDTSYRFGRLSYNGYSSSLNYIAFKDESQDRQCHIYTGRFTAHCPIYCSSNYSFHVESKGDGLTSDVGGWLVRYADGSNHNNMIMIGNSNHTSSVYGSGHIWKNGSSTTYLSTASTSSDRRLKEHISDLSHLENFFMQLSPIGFKYHDGLYNAEGTKPAIQWGFYAQDIIKDFGDNGMDWQDYDLVLKEMTDISKEEREYIDDTCDGILKVSYQNFTALHTYMIQKICKENNKLKDRIDVLERRIEQLLEKKGE